MASQATRFGGLGSPPYGLAGSATRVGGLGSLKGTVLASILLGEIEGLLSIFVSPVQARVLYFLLMITVLIFRPSGLLGKKGIRN